VGRLSNEVVFFCHFTKEYFKITGLANVKSYCKQKPFIPEYWYGKLLQVVKTRNKYTENDLK